MPALIGGFGNFLLPLGLGGPDMGFPRLNNISYLSLIPSIVLFLFAGGIENGVGTGWTLNMEYSEQMIMVGGIKLFSMREYPLEFNGLRYSWLFKSYVRMLMTRGQYAWVAKKFFVTHQRLNEEYLVKNKKEWFEQWLVGMTDGEGTFGFYKQNGKWVLYYKIVQSRYNLRALYYIKTNLGIGNIIKDGYKAQISITDRTKLNDVIVPIFDKYPMFSNKQYDYIRFRDSLLSGIIYSVDLVEYKRPNKDINDIESCINKHYFSGWLVGFIEGEGCFSVYKNTNNYMIASFDISQTGGYNILSSIRKYLSFTNAIQIDKTNNSKLKVTSVRSIENLIKFLDRAPVKLLGHKKLQYLLWIKQLQKIDRYSKKLNIPSNY